MEFSHNGVTYDIRISPAECDQRLGRLLASLAQPILHSHPASTDGAEAQSHAPAGPANPPRLRQPVRVIALNAAIHFSDREYHETTKKRPPGDQPGGQRTTCVGPLAHIRSIAQKAQNRKR